MADRCSASIMIGGALSAALLPDLVAAIKAEHLSTDYDGPPFEPAEITAGEALTLCAHDVNCGNFEVLEAFCREHGLAYSKWYGACTGAWSSGRSVWRGREHTGEFPDEYESSDDEHLLISEHVARQLGSYEAILAHFARGNFDVPPLVIVPAEPLQRETIAARA